MKKICDKNPRSNGFKFCMLTMFLAACLFYSLSVGIPELGLTKLFRFIINSVCSHAVSYEERVIFLDIRLPRTLLAMIAGSGLALAGTGTQAVLCNPLVSPSILGLSSGASLGASFAILFSAPLGIDQKFLFLICCAFSGAMLATLLCCFFAFFRQSSQETIVLAGIAVSYIFSGIMIFMQYHAPYVELRNILFWSVGSLWNADWNNIFILSPAVLIGFLLLYPFSLQLDSLIHGEEFSLSVGVNVKLLRSYVLLLSALVCSFIVAFTGAIGFIGLLAPHIARTLFGLNHRQLIPASMLIGAFLLLFSDMLAKIILWPEELPVGAMTSMIGGPFFLYLLIKRKPNWWA